jgi:hypothetical protein
MKLSVIIPFILIFCITVVSSVTSAQEAKTKRPSQGKTRESRARDAEAAKNKTKYTFSSGRTAGQIDNVKIKLKVDGEAVDVVDGKENREKLSSSYDLDYDEQTRRISINDRDTARSIRHYNSAQAEIKVGDNESKPILRAERTIIAAEIMPKKVLLFSPRGTLTRDELDLIEMKGDSLLLDRFLPEQSVSIGDTWTRSDDIMAQFLGLDEVGQNEIKITLAEVTDQAARFEMAGKVSGAIEGVASEVQINARFRFNLKTKRVDWLGMVIKEQRPSSPVADGFKVSAQLQVIVVPSKKSELLSVADLKDLALEATPELTRLHHASKSGGWEIDYDRDWYIYSDQKDIAILRRLQRGEFIAYCHLSTLARRDPDKLVTREEFQDDIKKALAKEFKEFVEAGESVDEAGHRVLRVVVRGTASDLAMLWTYYHVADRQGRQMSFLFTFEEKDADRLAGADRELVGSLRFVEK